ncbi:MBL fold metallo-hydrolase [Nonomuraea sp. NPDC050536]|uniref:MBL fold metallo-hydrolase n=1 Tax=Nonomuraea sp. NPDC050536 TaxID=3364366 RepID=UPI0037C6FE15
MPWELEIHTIDVGEGESALVIAQEPNSMRSRTLLIDGGLDTYGRTVHDYVAAQFARRNIARLDHVLVSGYDADHVGGVASLLAADNLYAVADTLALLALRAAGARPREQQIAGAAAAAYGACLGAYARPGAQDLSGYLVAEIAAARGVAPGLNDAKTAAFGVKQVRDRQANVPLVPPLHPSLIGPGKTAQFMAAYAGVFAQRVLNTLGVTPTTPDATLAALLPTAQPQVRNQILNRFHQRGPVTLAFDTGGTYAGTHVIDIGPSAFISDADGIPADHRLALAGRGAIGDTYGVTPAAPRVRTQAALGAEILWNSGPDPVLAPPGAPMIFVICAQSQVWDGPNPPRPMTRGGLLTHKDSIGLVVRFNDFFHYTGGDLPYYGSEEVAASLNRNGLPNPAGGTFPIPRRIATIKCGRHGSSMSTSAAFLAATNPHVAFISCGAAGDEQPPFNQPTYDHPDQDVITRLHNSAGVGRFYLTNCRVPAPLTHVPGSGPGLAGQLGVPGNKSVVCGDNAQNNRAPAHVRGNVRLTIDQAQSMTVAGGGNPLLGPFTVEHVPNVGPPVAAQFSC